MYNPQLVKTATEKIEYYLQQKGWPYEGDQSGFKLYQGSTYVHVTIKQWGENSLVCIRCPLALNVTNLNHDLLQMLMEKNYELILGKFSYNRNAQAIYYEHAILGNDLDPEELYSALESAAVVADKYDDQIALMSGGKRAID